MSVFLPSSSAAWHCITNRAALRIVIALILSSSLTVSLQLSLDHEHIILDRGIVWVIKFQTKYNLAFKAMWLSLKIIMWWWYSRTPYCPICGQGLATLCHMIKRHCIHKYKVLNIGTLYIIGILYYRDLIHRDLIYRDLIFVDVRFDQTFHDRYMTSTPIFS